jgi:hypothetical protein
MQTPVNSNDLSPNGAGLNALKEFQLSGNVKSKTDEKFGEKIVLQCEQIINSGYFSDRNRRFAANRAMAAGRLDTKKFMDFFNINGKTNYVNINWKSIMIVNTIISRLVGRWMTKKEKATVTAVDPVSVKQKKQEYDDAEFMLYNKDSMAALEQESGVGLISPDEFVPDDKDHLDLWAEEEQRIPEEILYEKGINTVLEECGWGDMGVNTRKQKHDSAEVGLIGTETIADKHGRIHVNYCKPENMFYSYSEYPDFRDSSIKGEIVSYKISDLRDLYPKLEVKELFEIAKSAKQWAANNKMTFDTGWNTNMFLPFDDWNVDCVRFTLRSLDVDKNLIKTAKDGSLYVDKPKKKIDDVYPGNEYIEKTIWNIYRGVYVRDTKKILEWGLEKNMIKPQEYEKISDAASPYSFYMYQNTQMRNLAVPEKIEEPVEQMILARLKIQQLVAKMRPSGYQYDIDGLQQMDLGNGIVKPLELQKITDQTGNVYFRSRDAEGNRLENPIRELPNAGSVAQLQQLIELYNYHLQVLRDEIGINEFAEGQSIKPRVGVENVQTSLEVSFNATDYMNDACVSNKGETADKVACLLHDSVEFGSREYRKLMEEKNVKNRNFKVKIEMLPNTEELTNLDNMINMAMANQPDLVLYINPEKIKRIARVNVKLAERYFREGQKRAIKGMMDKTRQDSEMNAKLQQESNEQAAQKAIELQQDKLAAEKEMQEFLSNNKKQELLLEKGLELYKVLLTPKTGELGGVSTPQQLPPALDALLNQTFNNIAVSLAQDSRVQQKQIQAEMEQEQMEQEQAEQMEQNGGMVPQQ